MTAVAPPVLKSVKAGAISGFVVSVVTGLLGEAGARSTGDEVFFVAIPRALGLGDASVVGGWALHLITGSVIGAIFLAVTNPVKMLSLTNWPRTIGIGAGAGIVV